MGLYTGSRQPMRSRFDICDHDPSEPEGFAAGGRRRVVGALRWLCRAVPNMDDPLSPPPNILIAIPSRFLLSLCRNLGGYGGRCSGGKNDADGQVCGEQIRRGVHHDLG